MNKRIIPKIVYTLLTALLLVFIFGNSAADGEESSGLSLMVTEWLNGLLSGIGIQYQLPHLLVRKLAHFSEYSVLGMLLTATVWAWRRREWRFGAVWLPMLCGVCVAALDEFLQTFVPERCGSPKDVLLDFCGVLWAAAVISLIIAKRQKNNQK